MVCETNRNRSSATLGYGSTTLRTRFERCLSDEVTRLSGIDRASTADALPVELLYAAAYR